MGVHDQELPFVLVDARLDEDAGKGHSPVVEQELGFEVVRAVEHDVIGREHRFDIGGRDPIGVNLNLDERVQGTQIGRREFALGLRHLIRPVDGLSVKVGDLEPVGLADTDMTDARCGEGGQCRCPQSPRAHHQHACVSQLLLAVQTYVREVELACVVVRRQDRSSRIAASRMNFVMVVAVGGAALAVHPPGVPVHVVLFLPDRYAVLHFVDDVAAGRKGLAPVSGAHPHPHRNIFQAEVAGAVYAGGSNNAKSFAGLIQNDMPFFKSESRIRLVFERAHLTAFVVIAHPALKARIAARSDVAARPMQRAQIEGLIGQGKHRSASGHGWNENHGVPILQGRVPGNKGFVYGHAELGREQCKAEGAAQRFVERGGGLRLAPQGLFGTAPFFSQFGVIGHINGLHRFSLAVSLRPASNHRYGTSRLFPGVRTDRNSAPPNSDPSAVSKGFRSGFRGGHQNCCRAGRVSDRVRAQRRGT